MTTTMFMTYSSIALFDFLHPTSYALDLLLLVLTVIAAFLSIRLASQPATIIDHRQRILPKIGLFFYLGSLIVFLAVSFASLFTVLFIVLQFFALAMRSFNTSPKQAYIIRQTSLTLTCVYVSAYLLQNPGLISAIILLVYFSAWLTFQVTTYLGESDNYA
jgi:hypothetical protein